MAVTISGTTGVGVSTTPLYPSDILIGSVGTTAGTQVIGARLTGTTSNADILDISNVRGTAGATWESAGWRIQQKVDATWMGYIQFNGTANGTNSFGISFGTGSSAVSANSVTERLRIDGSGNVTPGTNNTQTLGAVGDVWSNVHTNAVTATGNIQATSYNDGQLAGLRNKIINGNMGIAQRGTAAVTTGGYGPADRWRTDATGDTFSTTQGSFVSGDTLYDTGGSQYYTTVAITSVAGAGNYALLLQPIEDVRVLAGQTVTVSFWAKAAAGTPSIGISIDQVFGTGGSPSATATGIGQAQALTTTWTKYSKTFTVPSINGKTLGTAANTSYTQLLFWFDAGSTFNTRSGSIGQASKTVSIAQVQLEIGSVATPFEHRPIGMELALCQRYYQIGYVISSGYQLASQDFAVALSFLVTPRTTPTITPTAAGINTNHGTILSGVLNTSSYVTGALIYATATASGVVRIECSYTVAIEF